MIHQLIKNNILIFFLILICNNTNAEFFKPFDIVDQINSKSLRIPNISYDGFVKKMDKSNAIKTDNGYIINNINISFDFDEFYGTPISQGFYIVLDKSYIGKNSNLINLIEYFSEEKLKFNQKHLIEKSCKYGDDRLLIVLKKYDIWIDSRAGDNGCEIKTYISLRQYIQ